MIDIAENVGGQGYLLAPGETCITCTNRNFRGRMDSNQANLYLGLPLIVCKGIAKHVQSGQTLQVNISRGTVTVLETGETLQAEALGDQAMKILSAGGIKPMMRARFGK